MRVNFADYFVFRAAVQYEPLVSSFASNVGGSEYRYSGVFGGVNNTSKTSMLFGCKKINYVSKFRAGFNF